MINIHASFEVILFMFIADALVENDTVLLSIKVLKGKINHRILYWDL